MMVHYRYHGITEDGKPGDHFREGHTFNLIGIPDKPRTQGRLMFRKIGKRDVAHIVCYDVESKQVGGYFTSCGKWFLDHQTVWSPDGRVGDETWPLRLEGAGYLDWDRAIPVKQIRPLLERGAPRRGSVEYIDKRLFDFVKTTMRNKNAEG